MMTAIAQILNASCLSVCTASLHSNLPKQGVIRVCQQQPAAHQPVVACIARQEGTGAVWLHTSVIDVA